MEPNTQQNSPEDRQDPVNRGMPEGGTDYMSAQPVNSGHIPDPGESPGPGESATGRDGYLADDNQQETGSSGLAADDRSGEDDDYIRPGHGLGTGDLVPGTDR